MLESFHRAEAELAAQIADHRALDAARRAPLTITGQGSKGFYGNPVEGKRLSTRSLAGVLSYEPSELVVTVAAGTPLAELQALLGAQRQHLAFDPPLFAVADQAPDGTVGEVLEGTVGGVLQGTVGGAVSCGLSGPARASVGGLRDYVLGVNMLSGTGERLHFGGTVMKNVAGYDMSRLMAGAMGTLGLISAVSLKVLPQFLAEATLRFDLSQAQALDALNRWGGQPLPLNASTWLAAGADATDLASATAAQSGVLLLRLRGAVAAVASAIDELGRQGGQLVSVANAHGQDADATTAAWWAACRDHTLAFFAHPPSPAHGLWRLSVPQTAAPLCEAHAQLIEWHGAQRWLWATTDHAQALRQAAGAAGGHASCFRAPTDGSGAGLARFQALGAANARIQAAILRELDPAGLWARGRL